jgi:hypothetical protein
MPITSPRSFRMASRRDRLLGSVCAAACSAVRRPPTDWIGNSEFYEEPNETFRDRDALRVSFGV